MKEFERLLQNDRHYSEKARRFSARVKDICEFLTEVPFQPPVSGKPRKIAYHDACHLAHGQKVRKEPRQLIESLPGVQLIELEEADRCCGSAGIYNITQPEMAKELLDRKWKFIEESGAEIVATGNPGCLAWIQQAARERKSRIRVVHTAVALAEAFHD